MISLVSWFLLVTVQLVSGQFPNFGPPRPPLLNAANQNNYRQHHHQQQQQQQQQQPFFANQIPQPQQYANDVQNRYRFFNGNQYQHQQLHHHVAEPLAIQPSGLLAPPSSSPQPHPYRLPPPLLDPKIPDLLFTQEQNNQFYEYFEHQKRLNELKEKQRFLEEQQRLLEKQFAKVNGAGQPAKYFREPQSQQQQLTTTTTTTLTPPVKKLDTKKQHFLPTIVPSVAPAVAVPAAAAAAPAKTIESLEQLNFLEKQYENNLLNRDDLLEQIKTAIEKTGGGGGAGAADRNFTTREISLANGQRVQVIQTSDPEIIKKAAQNPNAIIDHRRGHGHGQKTVAAAAAATTTTTTTSKPPKEILEELTKNIIPPGVNFELLKSTENGRFEEIGAANLSMMNLIAQQKKVTFVLLEEQDDGTLKVQGIKGSQGLTRNGTIAGAAASASATTNNTELEKILNQIRSGEIQLPSSSSSSSSTTSLPPPIVSTKNPKKTVSNNQSKKKNTKISSTIRQGEDGVRVSYSAKKLKVGGAASSGVVNDDDADEPLKQSSSTNSLHQRHNTVAKNQYYYDTSAAATVEPTTLPAPTRTTTTTTTTNSSATSVKNSRLIEILRKNEHFAMAKYLKQSGLDDVLNETGPFTMFVPTDKAFRSLMIQLGGPEKAEEKFKQNPRLLSGLLLHHIIPSTFEIGSLQDEMTGVSLAGTQLRVNQYTMKDNEWNDIQITTINGARVVDDKKNIRIPQGIAQTVDRVMFPLPVGDLLQTLQSDRDARFANFTQAVLTAELAETLQGPKTYTVFAPVDQAFAVLTHEERQRIATNRDVAREFVLSYVVPGAVYTSGMHYYQIRDTLLTEKSLTIVKNSGRVKVNNHAVTIPNIPATNGVIHAIDSLL